MPDVPLTARVYFTGLPDAHITVSLEDGNAIASALLAGTAQAVEVHRVGGGKRNGSRVVVRLAAVASVEFSSDSSDPPPVQPDADPRRFTRTGYRD